MENPEGVSQLQETMIGKLGEGFDDMPRERIHGEYEMELPQEVIEFAKIIESLNGRVLIVGGCVRDNIRSCEGGKGKTVPKDIDMEVYGIMPEDLLLIVDAFFGLEEGSTFGKSFEVLKIFGRGRTYDLDISIPRCDNKTGSGSKGFITTSHPEYTITDAAKRRDLTCNSVSYDPLKKLVYDPFGGVDDIKNQLIRVTDIEKFQEDPVRILRMMQFVARFGWEIDEVSEKLCKEMLSKTIAVTKWKNRIVVGGDVDQTEQSLNLIDKSPIELDDESNNRIYLEFQKLLIKGYKPSLGLEFAKRIGLIDRYLPWLAELTITDQDDKHHPEGNVWEHTMQVVDAAAEVARREHLSDQETLILVMSALTHDLGKPTKTIKTTDETGKQIITSGGHDTEGGWLSSEMIDSWSPKSEKFFEIPLRAAVKVLTEEHMRPYQYYLEDQEGQNSKRKLGRLARRLADGGTNIRMLSLLAEADQRGRKPGNNGTYNREEVNNLAKWQEWIQTECEKYQIYKNLPEKILTGEMIMTKLNLAPGPFLGVIQEWIYQDQLDGDITDPAQAINKATEYIDWIRENFDQIKESNLISFEKSKKNINDNNWYCAMKNANNREKIQTWVKDHAK